MVEGGRWMVTCIDGFDYLVLLSKAVRDTSSGNTGKSGMGHTTFLIRRRIKGVDFV